MANKPIVSPGSPTTIQPVPSPDNPPPNAGSGLSTGDNGFQIDKQKYTYDTGAAGQGGSQGTYVQGVDVSKSYIDENGNPQDLKPATRHTLAQYLSKVTMGLEGSTPVKNKYPVNPPTNLTDADLVSTTTNGYPTALENPPSNTGFATQAEMALDYPTQQYATLASLIKKGQAPGTGVDGNDLLAGVTGTSTSVSDNSSNLTGKASPTQTTSVAGHSDTSAKIVNPYTSAVLSNNRFTNSADAYAPLPDVSDPGNFNPALTVQGRLGKWDSGGTPNNQVSNNQTITLGRLATIGPLLGMRATMALGATSSGADPLGAGLEASSLLPSPTQLGAATIDQHVLLAADVLKTITSDEPGDSNTLSIGTQSWGQLNSVYDPYSGADALGMLTLSVALTVGLTLIIDLLSLILGKITPQNRQPVHDSTGRYALGQYYANEKSATQGKGGGGALGAVSALASLNFGALLGINPTNYPFQMAMQTGFNAFFGLPQGGGGFGGLAGQLAGSLTSSTDSPEFNIIVARTIIRSSISLVAAFKKIGGNVMQAINAILAMVDTIRNSKIIAAMNVWSQLGDAILSVPQNWIDASTAGAIKFSSIDAAPDTVMNAMSQNRMNKTLKLAWASNRSRTQLILPKFIQTNSQALPALGASFEHMVGAKHDPRSLIQVAQTPDVTNGRISTTAAQAFEAQLGSEYVPFYFHDIRTNEIVGFHAFLTSLTEDFTPAYEKVDGFGRVDPVRIYKSTERKISMSFYVVATSELDFEDMWVKLNKLITLVYPQYTQGLQLSDQSGQYVFTQPFSQLIGAAPMIRIRLGDLIKSNYSKFALARLFGLGNTNFKVNGTQDPTTAATMVDQTALTKGLANALSNPNNETYYVADGTYPYIDPPGSGGGGLPVSIPVIGGGQQGPQYAPTFEPHHAAFGLPEALIVQAVDVQAASTWGDGPPGGLICKVITNNEPSYLASYSVSLDSAIQQIYGTSGLPSPVGGTYIIPPQALSPTPSTKTKLITAANTMTTNEFVGNLSTFLADTGSDANAVAKSFADTSGQGLAGFIESMNFDWYDQVTWETHQGKTAPKMCKVSINFAPVHDISPGIDHLGYNRGPIYQVGLYNPQPPTKGGN